MLFFSESNFLESFKKFSKYRRKYQQKKLQKATLKFFVRAYVGGRERLSSKPYVENRINFQKNKL